MNMNTETTKRLEKVIHQYLFLGDGILFVDDRGCVKIERKPKKKTVSVSTRVALMQGMVRTLSKFSKHYFKGEGKL